VTPTPDFTSRAVSPEPTPAAVPAGLVVALDGPASSGKSSVGAEVAQRLGYRFCDTGLLYRAVTWLALRRSISPGDLAQLVPLVAEVELVADTAGRLCGVRADGRDVTVEVGEAGVDRSVSDYARVAELRSALVGRQRQIASEGRIIMAGRDIGTTILPEAAVKIYLDASAEERAKRRAAQRGAAESAEAERILAELRRRDAIDASRETAPLRIAPNAVIIHTDGNTFDDTVDAVLAAIRSVGGGDGR
jgi:cytidylate kinase